MVHGGTSGCSGKVSKQLRDRGSACLVWLPNTFSEREKLHGELGIGLEPALECGVLRGKTGRWCEAEQGDAGRGTMEGPLRWFQVNVKE